MPSSTTLAYRAFTEDDIGPIADLQRRYAEVYPCRPPVPGQVYLSPAFDGGRNVRCACGADGGLLAYAAYYPQPEQAWVHLLSRADLAEADAIKDRLYDWLVERARRDGQARLAFQCFAQEDEYIRYARRVGADCAYSVHTLRRPLDQPIPDCPPPVEFEIRYLRMQTEAEQRGYVAARNECFPGANVTLEDWQFLARSPWWEHGACVAGFAGGTLAGSVAVFWEPGSLDGSTEYVFTRPAFRGKGLARALLAESLRYLKEHGLAAAVLEVKADNESALALYRGLGYAAVQESVVYEVAIAAV